MKIISVDRSSLLTIRNQQCSQLLKISLSNTNGQTVFDYSNENDVNKIAESIDYILTYLITGDVNITVTLK